MNRNRELQVEQFVLILEVEPRYFADAFEAIFQRVEVNVQVACEGASPEEVDAEVVRCLDTYGKWHRGYCFFGFRYANSLDPEVIASLMMPIGQKATEHAFELMMAGK